MAQYSVVLFHSAAHVIRGEKVLTRAGVQVKMIPTPRQISSDCGMALRLLCDDCDRAEAILVAHDVPTKGIFPLA